MSLRYNVLTMSFEILRPSLNRDLWLPSRQQLLKLKFGDTAKLIFKCGNAIEKMWVIIIKQQSQDAWTGVIDNNALDEAMRKELPYKKEVNFHPLDIIQIPTFMHRVQKFIARLRGRTIQKYLESKI